MGSDILGVDGQAGRTAASRAALRLWHREGKWANIALEGVSMDPIIRDGAMLRVKFGAPSSLKVGDVVLYLAPARLIAHRVVRMGRRGRHRGQVRVKGDPLTSRKAAWIESSEILGRVAAVTQPDGTRLYLNTPAGQLLNRAAAWVSLTLGALDARLPRGRSRRPAASLTGRTLAGLNALHRAAQRRLDRDAGRLLAPEDRFLVSACRPRLGAEDIARITRAGQEVLDWDQLKEQAVSLGLAPLLHRNLSDPRLAGVCPEERLAQLARASHLSAYFSMHRRQQLALVLDALRAESIEPILLKGAALSCLVYDDPSMRTMNDLDLLLGERDIPAAVAALRSLSYQPIYRAQHADPGVREAFYGRHHHATPLMEPRGRAVVELHRHIVTMAEPGRYDIERIRGRARRILVDGRPALVPCPADLVLHTCLHLSYADRFVGKLRDLLDLHATVIHYGEEIDWGQMLTEVPSDAAARCIYSCLDLARRLYGTPVPDDFLFEMRRASKLGFVSSRLIRALACSVLFSGNSARQTILTSASARWCCDTLLRRAGWSSRLRALASLLAHG